MRRLHRSLRAWRTEISLGLCGIGCAFLVAALVVGFTGSDRPLVAVAGTILAGVLLLGAGAVVASVRVTSRPRTRRQAERD